MLLQRTIEGIVFDVDGVLFDTEPLHMEAWLRTAEVCGFSLAKKDLLPWVGKPCADLARFLNESRRDVPSAGSILEVKEGLFRGILSVQAPLFDGVLPLLAALSARVPLAWATSSPRENVELLFRKAGISGFFHSGICVEDVSRPKPDPESYEKARRGIGVPAENCVALDDSPTGTAAASQAGLCTIGIVGNFKAEELKGTCCAFQSTKRALHWILKTINRR